jgi:hypothetical protein
MRHSLCFRRATICISLLASRLDPLDLWHQRLDHPGPTQLSVVANHITGL